MLLIEGLRSLQRPTYLQTPIGGHHHQLRSLDLVGQLTTAAPWIIWSKCVVFGVTNRILFAASMNLEECPLSKQELLKLVKEEAAMRVSASFLWEVGNQWVDNICIFLKFLGGTRGKRGQDRWNHGYPENARESGEETWASSWDGPRHEDCSDVVPRGPTILGPSCSGTSSFGLTSNYCRK